MRLLKRAADGALTLTTFAGKDARLPPYAILSHTWASNGGEEVSFQDIEDGTGSHKAGYEKIQFCLEQAAADGIQYAWIDTCCIDRKDAVELSEAINSMFRWYQNANRCYVYLADVSLDQDEELHRPDESLWTLQFRKSRWFTRGWTLQELIAPKDVAFFSKEATELGTKSTLESMVHEVTGIATSALRGFPLADITVEERMSWAEKRNATRAEDEVYSLLGIFDISMPLIYGEGKPKALRRLYEEISKSHDGVCPSM